MTATIVLALRIGLAIVLYYFLWRILQTLWRDLNQQVDILSDKKMPGIHIDATTDTGQFLKFDFRQTEILIGRGSHCSISLNDEALSANHARVSYHHGQWWLEDLNSRNGTTLNSDKITTPTVVISEDQFKCGNTILTLSIDSLDIQASKLQAKENGDK